MNKTKGNFTLTPSRTLSLLKEWQAQQDQKNNPNDGTDPCFFASGFLGLRSPLELQDIEQGIALLKQAIETNKNICILGDKDVDGVSSTALLASLIQERHKAKLELILPEGEDEYGLFGKNYQDILNSDADLVILLDVGGSQGQEVQKLLDHNKEVLILDHHILQEGLVPNTNLCTFLHPQRKFNPAASSLFRLTIKDSRVNQICTAALAFKFLLAYALSYTKVWHSIVSIPVLESIKSNESNPKRKIEKQAFFRCGHFLGVYENTMHLREVMQNNCTNFIMPTQEEILQNNINLEFTNHYETIQNYMKQEEQYIDYHYIGKLLFYDIVSVRHQLSCFIERIAPIAALGIMSDLIPLVDEHRCIVKLALDQNVNALESKQLVNKFSNMGYYLLLKALQLDKKKLVSRDISWLITPTLNAAGRMGKTRIALDILLCQSKEDEDLAISLIQELLELKVLRKEITVENEKILDLHLDEHKELLESPVLFCYHPQLKPGVSGIIASRLTEQYKRPVVYIHNEGKNARGSARSFNDVNIVEFLSQAEKLFLQFGGHAQAAGFSIEYKNIPQLEQVLISSSQNLSMYQPQEKFSKKSIKKNRIETSDKESVQILIHQLNQDLLEEIALLEPFGPMNEEPQIYLQEVKIHSFYYFREGLDICFYLKEQANIRFIAWQQGALFENWLKQDKVILDLWGYLEENTFRGRNSLQFRVSQANLSQQ